MYFTNSDAEAELPWAPGQLGLYSTFMPIVEEVISFRGEPTSVILLSGHDAMLLSKYLTVCP